MRKIILPIIVLFLFNGCDSGGGSNGNNSTISPSDVEGEWWGDEMCADYSGSCAGEGYYVDQCVDFVGTKLYN